jgi:preprotein translocase YajC subunit
MTAVLAAALVAATSKSSSGSSVTFVIFLVVIGVVGYFFLLRPQQQKARRQREAQSEISVGDEVVTVGGIVGTVIEIDSERATIITGADADGPGQPTRVVLVRNAIARKIESPVASEGTGGGGSSTNGTSSATPHPGYGGVPDDVGDGGEVGQGGAMQDDGGDEHEGAEEGPTEGEDR